MTNKPLIVVTGATGLQGGSVVNYLLEDANFRIRALTRTITSEKARELSTKGVEVVFADFDDHKSLIEAFKGAHGVFGVTDYRATLDAQKEAEQGRALVDAAKANGVKHFVWSTLDHTKDPEVPHANSKASVNDYLKASGVPGTSVYTVAYFEAFSVSKFFPLKKDEVGKLVADWPLLWSDGPIGAFAVSELGAYVLEAFKKPEEWIGKDIRVITEIITPRQVVQIMREVSGKEIELVEVDEAAFEKMRSCPGVEETWCNLKWYYKTGGNLGRDFDLSKRINPNMISFRDFVKANIHKITLN